MNMPNNKLQKILHVDDDLDIQFIAKIALESVGGFTVQQCSSGSEAIAKISEFEPDLLLLDVMMPNMDGEETLKTIRQLPRMENVPVVFMTAKALESDKEALIHKGAIDVITKPFEPMELSGQLVAAWEHARELA